MKTLSFFYFLLFFISSVLPQQNFHNDRLIIKIKDGIDFHLEQRQNKNGIPITFTRIKDIDQLNESFHCTEIIQKFPEITEYDINRWYLFKFAEPSNFKELFNSYLSLSEYFEHVEKLSIPRSSFIPNDPLLDSVNCKAYWDMHLPEAWNIETGNSGITVAVIDNGLDWRHPDIGINNVYQNITGGTGNYGEDADRDGHTLEIINNQIVFDPGDINGVDDDSNGKVDDFAGWNFANGNNNIVPPDPNSTHGTAIFGIISAKGNNNEGAAGVSFNSKVLHCKAGEDGDIGGDWLGAIVYAANMGAKVINMSFFRWWGPPLQYEQDIINYAYNVKNCVLVACGGFTTGTNCPNNNYTYPASYNNVIAASVLDGDGVHMRLNSYVNNKIDVLGSKLVRWPWYNSGQYTYGWTVHSSGTTAMTTGLAALLLAHYPTWNNEKIVNQILMTCSNRDDQNRASSNSCNFDFYGLIGNGLLNAYKALTFNGNITEHTIWSKTLKPHFTINVAPNISLTLRPNTQLLFNNNCQFIVNGNLIIEGNLTVNTNIVIEQGGSVLIKPGANITFLNGSSLICNSGGNSCYLPNPPTNLVLTNHYGNPKLTWNASPDNFVTGYDIFRGVSLDGTTPPNDYSLIGSTHRDTLNYIDHQIGIGSGQMYFYYVRAKNNSLSSSPSNSVSTRGSIIEKRTLTQIDTLYYLPDTTKFIANYLIADEIYYPHCRFKPKSDWDFYKIKEIHFLFSHMVIGDTLRSIAFFKDTLKTKIYEQTIDDPLDSVDVYPNWYKVIIDTNFAPIQGVIETPYRLIGLTDLASPTNISAYSGNSIGFHEGGQSWVPIVDRPVKLIIERSTTNVPPEIQNPKDFVLHQNYPNPFNPTTKIKYAIKEQGLVALKVYDILGREITALVNEPKQAGEYEVEFDPSNYGLSSGVYLYRLTSGSFSATRKFVYLR
jgi:hypothetical protein